MGPTSGTRQGAAGLVLAFLVLVAVVGIAAGAHPGRGSLTSQFSSLTPITWILVTLLEIIAIAFVVTLVVEIFSHRRNRRWVENPDLPELPLWRRILYALCAVGLLAAFYFLIYYVVTRSRRRLPRTFASRARTRTGGSTLLPHTHGLDVFVVTTAIALTIVAAAIVAYVIALRRTRNNARKTESAPEMSLGDLDRLLGTAVEDLRSPENENDPRQAVILAYARMEDLFGRAGTPRTSETPFEYVALHLTRLGVPERAAFALTDLFEQARFSTHIIGTDLRREALSALENVRGSVRTPA